ncbi:MAG: SUMF1/EgtB/PvdO family nonheme iron enzyme [Chitinispirillaceae bacterium]|nr:SUMF1/EgtB/PvdO family nonheme iron enzyme [Chitinispirillaceae bacterium]
MPPEEYHLNVNWTAAQGTMIVFADYTIPYETGKDDFAGMSAYTVPAGFLNPSASVTWNLAAKTATIHFIRTGQCLLFFSGSTPDNSTFTDSCLVTVGNPFSISGDAIVSAGDTAEFVLAPRPVPAQMSAGVAAEWSVNGVSSSTGVADTFEFSDLVAGSRSVIASFVDTAHGDTVRLDTFPFIVGDFRLSATWPVPSDSLAPFTPCTFSYQTGADPFDSVYLYAVPAGFLDADASVALDTAAKTCTVYFIAAGQCRLCLSGIAPGGRRFGDSSMVTVRTPWSITGDSAVDIRDTARLFLAPRPDPASLIPGTAAEWSAGGTTARIGVTDTFSFSNSVSSTRQVIVSFVDTVHGNAVRIDTFPLKFNEYRLAVDPPAQPDSLAIFTRHAFPYQTGPDSFDSMYAYIDPNSFINPASSVTWDTGAKTVSVYFIEAGQCRLHVVGRTSDGRLFTDSCSVTVRNPFTITGDSAVRIRDTARFFIIPTPDPASMAPGLTAEWRVNGVPRILGVDDTLKFCDSIAGSCQVIAAFVDATHRDTVRLDTFSVKIGDFRLSVTWPLDPDSLALFTLNAFSFQTGLDPFDTMYAYTEPAGFINPAASAALDTSAKTGTVYLIREGQCRLFLAGRAPGGSIFTDSCLVTVRNPWTIAGDTAIDIGQTARLALTPPPSAASLAPGTMVEWSVNGTSELLNAADTFDFSSAVSGTSQIVASLVDPAHGDTARIDTFSLRIKDYRLTMTGPAHPDSLVLFTENNFSYQTGADPFDSVYVYTSPAGFINPAASIAMDTAAKTGKVYFIVTGPCMLYIAGGAADGRTCIDSCPVTVRNPFGISGDTVTGILETARFFLAPRPNPDSMAPATAVEWRVNGSPEVMGLTDTFDFSGSVTGDYQVIVSLVDTLHGDTARADTLSLRLGYRLTTTAYGTGSGTISPANPVLAPSSSQVFTFTPAPGSVIARLFTGTTQTASVATYTWTNVTAPDSLKVMFFAVPAQSRPIPSQGVSFRMGSDHASLTFYGPAHLVTLTYGYFMDSAEVSQNDYFDLMGVAPSYFTGNVNRPVENMTWYDAVLYCNERSKRDGLDTVYRYTTVTGPRGDGVTALGGLTIDYAKIGYRLPTEAECEYALRAGSETEYYWGRGYPMATLDDTLATDSNVVWQHNSGGSTQTVASKKPNAWGMYDMIGNVAEFCNDWYAGYTSTWLTDPIGPGSGTQRVQRGGGWLHIVDHSFTSAGRFYEYPYNRANFIGFRTVLQAAK